MSATPNKYIDFYNDGEKEVLVEVDFGTLRWTTYNIIASYINKLQDKLTVYARGTDRVAAKGAIDILNTLGSQLLMLAEAIEYGPPENEEGKQDYTVTIPEELRK